MKFLLVQHLLMYSHSCQVGPESECILTTISTYYVYNVVLSVVHKNKERETSVSGIQVRKHMLLGNKEQI